LQRRDFPIGRGAARTSRRNIDLSQPHGALRVTVGERNPDLDTPITPARVRAGAAACGPFVAALAAVAGLGGCSITATIGRNFGPEHEGQIVASDATSLRVRDPGGYEAVIPREDVSDIDHPGNVLFTIGAVVAGMTAPLMIGDLASHSSQDQNGGSEWSGMGLVVGLVGLATGISLMAAGAIPHQRSKRAAAAFEAANPVLPVVRPVYFYPPPPGAMPPPFPPPATAP
jgi:hypothetical protein